MGYLIDIQEIGANLSGKLLSFGWTCGYESLCGKKTQAIRNSNFKERERERESSKFMAA